MEELKPCTHIGFHCWHDKTPMKIDATSTVCTAVLMNRLGVCCWCGQEQPFYSGVPPMQHGSHHPPNYFISHGDGVTQSFYMPPR